MTVNRGFEARTDVAHPSAASTASNTRRSVTLTSTTLLSITSKTRPAIPGDLMTAGCEFIRPQVELTDSIDRYSVASFDNLAAGAKSVFTRWL